jgi:hypothetical protein
MVQYDARVVRRAGGVFTPAGFDDPAWFGLGGD